MMDIDSNSNKRKRRDDRDMYVLPRPANLDDWDEAAQRLSDYVRSLPPLVTGTPVRIPTLRSPKDSDYT